MLATSNLMIFYENALAINNVSLEVEQGEIVAVLGSNGAGKSTLMYTLAGIILDEKLKEERRGGEKITILGEIELWGEKITALKARARVERGIVLCPERRRVFPESSVLENLRIGGHRTNRAEEKEMIAAVWDLFPALWPLRKQRAGFLSGGEQQMLAIGRALMAKPRLFLLDEPLLGLAPSVQIKVIEAIERIAERGVTVLVAEQYARPILPIVKRGYVIESGSITLSGTGEQLSENPHVRTAYFGI